MLWPHYCSPNQSFYKPAAGSHSIFFCLNILWGTTVLQTKAFISPQQGLIHKQIVLICLGAPLFFKLKVSVSPQRGSIQGTTCFNMRWCTTVFKTSVFINALWVLFKNNMFQYVFAHHFSPNYSLCKPASGSYPQTFFRYVLAHRCFPSHRSKPFSL